MRKIGFILLAICTLLTMCDSKNATTETQLYQEYKDAYYRAIEENTEMVCCDILLDIDTAVSTEESYAMKAFSVKGVKQEWVKIEIGDRIITREFYKKSARFDIYDSLMNFKSVGFLPMYDLTMIYNPDSDFQKGQFYDQFKDRLRQNKIELCEKYGITEDSLEIHVAFVEARKKMTVD